MPTTLETFIERFPSLTFAVEEDADFNWRVSLKIDEAFSTQDEALAVAKQFRQAVLLLFPNDDLADDQTAP